MPLCTLATTKLGNARQGNLGREGAAGQRRRPRFDGVLERTIWLAPSKRRRGFEEVEKIVLTIISALRRYRRVPK